MNEYSLLLEIYSEEIPAFCQQNLAINFKKFTIEEFAKSGIRLSDGDIETHCTCYRLILLCKNTNTTDTTSEIDIKIFENILLKLQKTLPKNMKWPQSNFEWIRPIRNIILIENNKIKQGNIFSIELTNKLFLEKFNFSIISNIGDYIKEIESANILYRYEDRYKYISDSIERFERKFDVKFAGNTKLIEEICGIIEKIFIIEAELPSRFLTLPKELINLVLVKNQKYIMFYDTNGQIFSHFIIIANANERNEEIIKIGNQKVINARLEDAVFYWDRDLLLSEQSLKEKLFGMNFYGDISFKSQFELQEEIVNSLQISKELLEKLRLLIYSSKLDLASNIISEFPELQGIIGSYYATRWSCDDECRDIIKRQYKKVNSDINGNQLYQYFIVIDRLSYITQMAKIGNLPTSSGDPFAIKNKIDDLLHCADINVSIFEILSRFFANDMLEKLHQLIIKRFEKIYIKDEKSDILDKFCKIYDNDIKNATFCEIINRLNGVKDVIKNDKFISIYKRILGFNPQIKDTIDKTLYNSLEKEIIHEIELSQNLDDSILIKIENYIDNNRIDSDLSQSDTKNIDLIGFIFMRFSRILDARFLSK